MKNFILIYEYTFIHEYMLEVKRFDTEAELLNAVTTIKEGNLQNLKIILSAEIKREL